MNPPPTPPPSPSFSLSRVDGWLPPCPPVDPALLAARSAQQAAGPLLTHPLKPTPPLYPSRRGIIARLLSPCNLPTVRREAGLKGAHSGQGPCMWAAQRESGGGGAGRRGAACQPAQLFLHISNIRLQRIWVGIGVHAEAQEAGGRRASEVSTALLLEVAQKSENQWVSWEASSSGGRTHARASDRWRPSCRWQALSIGSVSHEHRPGCCRQPSAVAAAAAASRRLTAPLPLSRLRLQAAAPSPVKFLLSAQAQGPTWCLRRSASRRLVALCRS